MQDADYQYNSDGDEEDDDYEDDDIDFETWPTEDLRQYLRDRTLYAGGSKDEVIGRVRRYWEMPDFSTQTAKELKQYLRERGLDTSGNKQVLQDRIIEHFNECRVSGC